MTEPGAASLFGGGDSSSSSSAAASSSGGREETVDHDAPLRADIRAMGTILGQIVKEHHGDEIFAKIEDLRALSKQWRMAGAGRGDATAKADAAVIFQQLSDTCAHLTNAEIFIIARAFTFFLGNANAAEGQFFRSSLVSVSFLSNIFFFFPSHLTMLVFDYDATGHHRIRRLNMATREGALPDRYDSW